MPISLLAFVLVLGITPAGASPPPERRDPYLDQQWHLHLIGAPESWRTTTGKGAVVAVIDQGVSIKHPDLAANVHRSKGIDFTDPTRRNGNAVPGEQHGTAVAGLIAAVGNNGRGIAGVAPDARILPIRATGSGEGAGVEAIIKGIRYAARKKADVINISLGGGLPLPSGEISRYLEAIDHAWRKGAVVVKSAGNRTLPVCDQVGRHPRVLCVGSSTAHDLPAHYTNVDASRQANFVMAPGGEYFDGYGYTGVACDQVAVLTTMYPADLILEKQPTECSPEAGYDVFSGTSAAAPVVSGVAALLASQGLTNEEILETILTTAADLGAPGRDPVYGYGRVDALRAVERGAEVAGARER